MSVAGEYRRRTKGDRAGGAVAIGVAAVVFGLLLLAIAFGKRGISRPQESPVIAQADPKLQAQRLTIIRTLQRNGVLEKIDDMGGSIPKAYVLVGWQALTFDQKQAFAGVWLAYWYQLPREAELQRGKHLLTIRDAYTGKDVGSFDASGLRLK